MGFFRLLSRSGILMDSIIFSKEYIKEENALLEFYIPGINERQAQIIKTIVEKGNTVFVSRELENVMNVSVKTIRSDLEGLVQLGLLEKVPMNKRLFGYTKSSSFESRLREIRGN